MISLKRKLLIVPLLLLPIALLAQTDEDARALVKQGIQLHQQKQYPAAIEKYSQALKIDTGYLMAGYQMALSLYALNKPADGIPFLRKLISNNTSLKFAALDLLALSYFRERQYGQGEQCAIEAIKLDQQHAGTVRTYALVCFHQNKRAAALLGFCSFILLEPATQRAAEAFGNIQHILAGGDVKAEPNEKSSLDASAANAALNQIIDKAAAEAKKQKFQSAGDLLTAELKAIFIGIGQMAEKQNSNNFFRNYLALYFYKLAQSGNMPAFARFISPVGPERAAWIDQHLQQLNDLDNWLKTTQRSF